jgi:hypothetical protein
MLKKLSIAVVSLALSAPVLAEKEFENHTNMMDHGDGHLMDMTGGMIMGQNTDILPGGCDSIAQRKKLPFMLGINMQKNSQDVCMLLMYKSINLNLVLS